MSSPRTFERRAIVLGRTDYRDADRIVHLLTPEDGRISALARSARRSKKRFGGALDPGNVIQVLLSRGKGDLWALSEADVERGHLNLREDLVRLAQSAYLVDFVAALARREHPEPRLFSLLEVGLLVLDSVTGPPSPLFILAFEMKALTFSGFAPQLQRCASCGALPGPEPLAYDPGSGGLLHQRCGAGTPVSAGWAEAMESARRTRLADLVDTPLPPGPINLFFDHLIWQTSARLRSRKFLIQIGGLAEHLDLGDGAAPGGPG